MFYLDLAILGADARSNTGWDPSTNRLTFRGAIFGSALVLALFTFDRFVCGQLSRGGLNWYSGWLYCR